jgi:single-strand DNA-binding protein
MLNKCCFIGNVGRDPEIRSMQDGREIANLSLGVTDKWKDKNTGERKEKTEWIRITIFNENLVKVVKNYVKKGSKLYIEGQMQTRKYTDKDGAEKYSTEVVLQNYGGTIVMLDGKKDSAPSTDDQWAKAEAMVSKAAATKTLNQQLDDEIPFSLVFALALSGMAFIATSGLSYV